MEGGVSLHGQVQTGEWKDGQDQTGEWKEGFLYMVKSKPVSGRKFFSRWSSPDR